MKKTSVFTALLALASFSVASALQAKEWKTVVIGLEGAYEPWNLTKPDGSLDGFEVDLVNDLCARMKVECKLTAQDWDSMIPSLNAGKFDVIMDGMSITDERKKQIDFTRPYAATPVGFATLKSSPLANLPGTGTTVTLTGDDAHDKADVDKLRDTFKGKNLGVQTATNYAVFLEKYLKDTANITEYKTSGEADLDMTAGRLDAVFNDITYFNSMMAKPDYAQMALTGPQIAGMVWGPGIGAGIRKSDPDLRDMFNKAIGEAVADGTIKKLSGKWFKIDVTPPSSN